MNTIKKEIELIYAQDWYFMVLLLLIGFFTILTYYQAISLDLGLASLIVLLFVLFFSLEEVFPKPKIYKKKR
ncbi:MAG: hypothetical protein QXD62_03300 [Candidatus Woesearchaeota archaeon]